MSEEDFDDFAEKVKVLVMEIRAGVCPIDQCGGELEYLEERTNWQEPDLRCKNCGALWILQNWGKESFHQKVHDAILKDIEKRKIGNLEDSKGNNKLLRDMIRKFIIIDIPIGYV